MCTTFAPTPNDASVSSSTCARLASSVFCACGGSKMTAMSDAARDAYRALVYETPGFMDYWRAATPIEEIRHLGIGSRPTYRHGALDIRHIRAIPWVFSWMQSRFNLPSWYGLGAAMHAQSKIALLKEMYSGWEFFRALLDNAEMSLLKADMGIAALYSELVPDRALAARIFQLIRAEYDRTCEMIFAISSHTELMEADPVIQRSVQLRNPDVDPLNYVQVEMLRRIRALSAVEGFDPEVVALEQGDHVLQVVLLLAGDAELVVLDLCLDALRALVADQLGDLLALLLGDALHQRPGHPVGLA